MHNLFQDTTSFNAHHKSQPLGAHKKTRSFSNGHKTWPLLMFEKKAQPPFNVHKPSSFDATSFSFTKLFVKPYLSNVFIIHSFPFHAQITRSFLLLAFFHDCHLFQTLHMIKNTKKWCETWDFNSFSSFALFFFLLSHLHPMFFIAPCVC